MTRPSCWQRCDALIGGATAGILWEITGQGLVWYFGALPQVSVVYGSLTTAIIVLLSFEIVATLLLFGAQVIAEYEHFGQGMSAQPPKPAVIGTEIPVTASRREG